MRIPGNIWQHPNAKLNVFTNAMMNMLLKADLKSPCLIFYGVTTLTGYDGNMHNKSLETT